MKKFLAVVLALTMLLPLVFSLGTVAGAETVTAKPFYAAGWSDINRLKFDNLEGLIGMSVKDNKDGTITLSYAGKTDPKEMAAAVKKVIDRAPEGLRHVALFGTYAAFYTAPEAAIYMDKGIEQLKTQFTAFIKEYHAIGGKLDSLTLDTEYVNMGSWYIYSKFYGGLYEPKPEVIIANNYNRNIYNDIVSHPKYATEVRPLLAERGFKFYENVGGNKSEVWSMFPNSYLSDSERAKYSGCEAIWNAVMDDRLANYLNYAVLEPLMTYYPNAIMSDYQEPDSYAWLKSLGDNGSKGYLGGNGTKVGNASNYNTYSSRPSSSFYVDSKGNYLYQNPAAYNKADYEDDAYNMFLWDVNKFKNIYASTVNKKLTAWIAEYDYNVRPGSASNTPYYSETILHIGLLNPEPFLIYIYDHDSKFTGTNGTAEYNKRMQVISELLKELTRMVGYSDRTPIETQANWNDGFVLSGMYANGRNVWRLTPDTTDGTTVASFKVKDQNPTFTINGTTITFPQGKIVADGAVSVVGTGGYWIETPKNVQPVITRDADRYAKNPSLAETFEGYTAGTVFTGTSALPAQTWQVTATSDLLITAQGGSNTLALTGTADLKNTKLPANITAGDSYAKRQAWEISFTLPEAMNAGSNVKLLTTSGDGGIKLEGGKVYYDNNRTYQELGGVTLEAGQKYTVKREVNFTAPGAYTCSYTVYNASGAVLGYVADVPMSSNTVVPAQMIGISSAGLTTKVLLDDYKLYPTGLTKDLSVYNAKTGIEIDSTAKNEVASVAYRLSWMNATNQGKKVNVKAAYYNANGAQVSAATLASVDMAPGADGVLSGIVVNTTGKVAIYLEEAGSYNPVTPPTTQPTVQPTTQPTVKPTTQPTVQPTTPPATNPIETTTPPATTPGTTPTTGVTVTPTDVPATQPGTTVTDATTPSGTEATTPCDTQATTPDGTQAPTEPDSTEEKKGMSGGTIALIVVAVVLVLGGAGAGVYFYLNKKKSK